MKVEVFKNIQLNILLSDFNQNQSPLTQFEIRDLFDFNVLTNFHISITNIGFYLMTGAILLFIINLVSTNYNKLVSNN